jgi:hypothetical protein
MFDDHEDWFFNSYTERRLKYRLDELREHADAQDATADDLRHALHRSQTALKHLSSDVHALSAMIASLGEALAVAGVIDGARLRERYEERMKLVDAQPHATVAASGAGAAPPDTTPKIVRTRECVACGTKNRGDADVCAKCGATF